jgi:hypothetical protein
MAFKRSLTLGQRLRLFAQGARNNLCTVAAILNGAHIMNELFIVTRLAQGFLALTIVSSIVGAIQLSLVLGI